MKNEIYRFDYFRQHDPRVYAFIENRLTNEYQRVYERDKYTVYARRSGSALAASSLMR